MNLTMNTQWSNNNRRTYLIVTVSADGDPETSASQIYLDIQMPQGVRMRHIGKLSSDGHGNSIGVDVPKLVAGDHQDIVFKVKSCPNRDEITVPELHLHWIDSASGDLVERHQTGTPLSTESTEANHELTEIVTTAQSEHQTTRRYRQRTSKEDTSMNTEPDAGNRHDRRHRKGHFHRAIEDMQKRMNDMERRMHRMQRKARFERDSPNAFIEERETHREIVRTRRNGRSDHTRGNHRRGRRMHAEGRRMGRIMNRAFAASLHSHDDRHLDT